jgi:hypothetical protein
MDKWLDYVMQWLVTLAFVLGAVLSLRDGNYALAFMLLILAGVAWALFNDAIKNT